MRYEQVDSDEELDVFLSCFLNLWFNEQQPKTTQETNFKPDVSASPHLHCKSYFLNEMLFAL